MNGTIMITLIMNPWCRPARWAGGSPGGTCYPAAHPASPRTEEVTWPLGTAVTQTAATHECSLIER